MHNINNGIIIDIRSPYKFNISNIPNSINISEYELTYNHNQYLNKVDTYYLYCDYGNRSKKLVSYLCSLGYKCVNIEGGFNNYLREK
jgi:rhodanese-related sulfurtransferase